MPDGLKDPNTVSSEEMAALIRGDIPDPRDARPEGAEPDVVVEKEREEPEATAEPSPTSGETSQAEPDDRQRLLSTIERMEQETARLRSEIDNVKRDSRRGAEPPVEMVEYLPGIRLPKDVSQMPIQLTPDHLKAIGIEPSPELAKGLSILGSALLLRADAALRPYIDERYQTLSNMRENASRGTASFFDAYPDLAGQDDFIALIEQGARERDRIHEIYRGEAYTREVARRVRTRIAGMRGQSLQDYENGLEGGTSTKRPVSRATVSAPRRASGTPKATGEQSEIDAVIDGR